MVSITDNPQNEYWYHVSNQNEIPIAGNLQTSINLNLLLSFLERLPSDEESQKNYLRTELISENELMDLLRTLVGVSDKRMYLELSFLFSKKLKRNSESSISGDTLYNLNKHPLNFFQNLMSSRNYEISYESVNIISDFLIHRGIISIINTFSKLSHQEISNIIEKLILTKEVQQEEAKRRGHGAESELAKLLNELNCELIPRDKHINPMGARDPSVYRNTFQLSPRKIKDETWSFDLVIANDQHIPSVFIQGLIHTSDPGQYGVNKSDETVNIKRSLSEFNRRNNNNKELWGLVDGVGFCENKKDTINKMLDQFDNFIQLKSLYKAALRLHKLGDVVVRGIRFDQNFYSSNDLEAMFQKYASNGIVLVETKEQGELLGNEIQAGKAWIYV
jgi:hypothetical protein